MEIPRIAVQDVARRIEAGERVAFVDARSARALQEATEQIPGSIRVPPDDIERHAGAVPRGATVVAYCT